MRITAGELQGRTVVGADGHALGEVTGLVLDTQRWSIELLQVTLRKEAADLLGARRPLFRAATTDIPVRLVHAVADAVVLSVALSALNDATAGQGDAAHAP